MKLALVTFVAIIGSIRAEILPVPSEDGIYFDAPNGTICEAQIAQQAQRAYNRCMR